MFLGNRNCLFGCDQQEQASLINFKAQDAVFVRKRKVRHHLGINAVKLSQQDGKNPNLLHSRNLTHFILLVLSRQALLQRPPSI